MSAKEYCEYCGCPIEICCAKRERLRTKKEIEKLMEEEKEKNFCDKYRDINGSCEKDCSCASCLIEELKKRLEPEKEVKE